MPQPSTALPDAPGLNASSGRLKKLSIRVTEEERQQFHALADATNISTSDLVRHLLLGTSLPEMPTARRGLPNSLKPELSRLLFEINKVGSNINQLLKIAHTTGDVMVLHLEKELQALKLLRLRVRHALATGQ